MPYKKLIPCDLTENLASAKPAIHCSRMDCGLKRSSKFDFSFAKCRKIQQRGRSCQNKQHQKVAKNKRKHPKSEDFRCFSWSCWADSNRRPHPYQAIFGVFYNNFCLFLVVFVPKQMVFRTFLKCSLRCFHACLWWNCGQPASPVC